VCVCLCVNMYITSIPKERKKEIGRIAQGLRGRRSARV
jgi:hypothetical protein